MAINRDVGDKQAQLKANLLEHLYNPAKLRGVVTSAVLLVGYLGVYMPLSGSIDSTGRDLRKEEKRLELACEVEHLRSQFDAFKDRLPAKRDPNEWVQYVLDGVRKLPVKMAKLDSEAARIVGPYKVVVLRMELEGAFKDLDKYLEWLETNQRLIRIDSVKIAPHRSGNGVLVMQLVVLGVMG